MLRVVRLQQIVAVMRGRQEVGPRALGHRSLLAYPDRSALLRTALLRRPSVSLAAWLALQQPRRVGSLSPAHAIVKRHWLQPDAARADEHDQASRMVRPRHGHPTGMVIPRHGNPMLCMAS